MASCLVFVCFLIYLILDFSVCFNIDTDFPLVFVGPRNSYFGFAVQLYRNREGPLALITAPKANSSYETRLHQPGVLKKCNIESLRCEEIMLRDTAIPIPIGSDRSYTPKKDDMLLGISLDIEPKQEGNIVTCGHLWKNNRARNNYFANGACYVINSTFDTVHLLLPLVEWQNQTIPGVNFYAHGMAGFSVSYTMDGEDLLLGSPGIYEGKGSIVDYDLSKMSQATYEPIIPNPQDVQNNILGNDAYVGYSVTSGRFGEYEIRSIVAGAPRCKGDCGCVYLFRELNDRNKVFIVQDVKQGEKMGDYFGAAVLGVNINNDEYTDLLVGAPLYSTEHGGDEGRVYVFMGSKIALSPKGKKLQGSRRPNARFGSTISSAGDLNQDGFTDIAVGAPYEEDVGAVYIFHGSRGGIIKQYVQRITPTDMKMNAVGFGISISKGMDIDDNGYPDILVGAYETTNAALLRSKPIIKVYSEVKSKIKQIKINSTMCNVDGKEESCFDIKYCLKYTGTSVPEKVDLKVHLTVDVHRMNYQPRCYFIEKDQHVSTVTSEITISKSKDNCYDRKVYIEENVQDFLTRVQFLLRHELQNPQSSKFCKTCPIIHQNTRKPLSWEISFWTPCRNNDVCFSDVKLHVSFNIGDGEPLIVGMDTVLVIDITIENTGDPAYETVLNACLPANIEIINQGDCTSNKKPENITLNCIVANPLYSDHPARLQLKLDTSKVPGSLEQLQFQFWVETTSNETNPADNYVSRIFRTVVKAAILITGLAANEVIFIMDESPEELIPIKHTYIVSKNMPSPIPEANITLSIPMMLPFSKMPFLEVKKFTVDKENNIPYTCTTSKGDFVQFDKPSYHKRLRDRVDSILPHHPSHSGTDTVTLDCANVVCRTFNCVAGPFTKKQKSIIFEIVATINFTRLEEQLGKQDAIVFVSEGIAEIQDKLGIIDPAQRKSNTTVINIVEKVDLHTTPVNYWWIILVSVLSGVILVILIILLLLKLGFFRRKEQEEMERMTHEGRLEKKDADEEERMALYNGNST